MEAYQYRRRREMADLWRVFAHAQHKPEKPKDALPPAPRKQHDDEEQQPASPFRRAFKSAE